MTYFGDNGYWSEPTAVEVDQVDLVNMGQYNVQEAKTRLSELLNLVERGEDVVIAKSGRPVARLVKIERPLKRELGFLAPLHIPDDFYEPWTDEEMGVAE
ncbi:type II toxin-antitoxin system Phd/YefM family antitoxin [Pseudarthrobacter enclensis]|uniref:Antitoxin n=1 Tax=Pseudarthrobacter enclensis TaxID=993070 RepID=A0ABT9RP46_9MICC|nr:type II toxin-antitoxin system prevent-host-death family antitoxin [Pseudarthrobacter enclensis]MDP9886827.1 prevent-host-death family protein [Pseudarthrobacter enclensis]